MTQRTGDILFNLFNYLFLFLFAFVVAYPFYHFLILSFNDGFDTLKGGIYCLPRVFTFENYKTVFENKYILTSYGITIFRTVIGTALSTLFSAMVAYSVIKKQMPGRRIIILYMFFPTLFTGGLIPFYLTLKSLHLTNSIWIYIFVQMFNFLFILILRTYFETLPDSLAESAVIDGCSDIGIFFKIYLPMSAASLATITLFYAVYHWNDWFTGAYYVTDKNIIPAATLLQEILKRADFAQNLIEQPGVGMSAQIKNHGSTPESLRMTFLVVTTLPVLFVYLPLQKYFVGGVMLGSLKE